MDKFKKNMLLVITTGRHFYDTALFYLSDAQVIPATKMPKYEILVYVVVHLVKTFLMISFTNLGVPCSRRECPSPETELFDPKTPLTTKWISIVRKTKVCY